ncbi:MAG: molybdopterin molybdotransferase MoeA, partial [Tsuneonella sp.]
AFGVRPDRLISVIGESRAGNSFAGPVGEGEAVRIFTGAPMPVGADWVVIQENAVREGDTVRFPRGVGETAFVRKAGSDFAAGAVLLPAGTRLTSRAMVAAAAADHAEVAVAAVPRVALFATGDEIAAAGTAHLRPDAIPDSVSPGIAAMIAEAGGRLVERLAGADDLDTLSAIAGKSLANADLVVVTGGASVGERDFAKPMFVAHGLDIVFDKVAIKPGKPVWFGKVSETWVLGLPGNPTSAMVTAALFLRPILARLQGAEFAHLWRRMQLAAELPRTGHRETFARARWDAEGLVPLPNQDSGSQATLLAADWLIRCPLNQPAIPAGEWVTALGF